MVKTDVPHVDFRGLFMNFMPFGSKWQRALKGINKK